jgi:ribosomal protein S13
LKRVRKGRVISQRPRAWPADARMAHGCASSSAAASDTRGGDPMNVTLTEEQVNKLEEIVERLELLNRMLHDITDTVEANAERLDQIAAYVGAELEHV